MPLTSPTVNLDPTLLLMDMSVRLARLDLLTLPMQLPLLELKLSLNHVLLLLLLTVPFQTVKVVATPRCVLHVLMDIMS
jgi:hypothetical protein